MDVEIEDIVMADLNTDSVYVHNSISIAGLLQMEYTTCRSARLSIYTC